MKLLAATTVLLPAEFDRLIVLINARPSVAETQRIVDTPKHNETERAA